jgi:hypothetical protein
MSLPRRYLVGTNLANTYLTLLVPSPGSPYVLVIQSDDLFVAKLYVGTQHLARCTTFTDQRTEVRTKVYANDT